MLKHLLAIAFAFVIFNTSRAAPLADTITTRLSKTDSVVKRVHKTSSRTKRLMKKDSTLAKTDTTSVHQLQKDTVKHLAKKGSKSKHALKADTTASHLTKTDTLHKSLHKGKATVKHSNKKDTTLHLPVNDTTRKIHAADTAAKRSPVSTLSYEQYEAYTKGEDINGFSQLAESNHYPMPGKVLKMAKQVGLTPLQTTKITAIANELERKKKEMGVFVIRNERVLDSLFRTNKLNDGLIIFYTNRSGLYYGELRNAILQACFATQKLLTALQIKRYEAAYKPN